MSSQLLAARFRFYPKPLSQTGTSSLANLSFFQPTTRTICEETSTTSIQIYLIR
ncbi:hypothetical protein SNK05_13696 [Fusarium graminearum]